MGMRDLYPFALSSGARRRIERCWELVHPGALAAPPAVDPLGRPLTTCAAYGRVVGARWPGTRSSTVACHSFTRSQDILRGGKHAQTLQGVDDAGCIRSDRRSNRRYRWRQCTTRHRRRRRRRHRRRRRPRQRQRHRRCRLLRHHRDRVRPGERGDRRGRHHHRPRRVLRVERHPHRLHRRPRLRGADQRSGREREPARHRHLPAAGQARRLRPQWRPVRPPDDVLTNVSANWAPTWMSFGNVDGTQYGVPIKTDIKSLVWYIPSKFAEYGYTVPTTLDEFYALDRPDDRRRSHPAVRRHRVRPGHRVAVHRLGRGAGAAQRRHRLLQPVVATPDPVQRPADRRGDADRGRPVGQARRGVRRLAARSQRRRSEPTPSRCSTATA